MGILEEITIKVINNEIRPEKYEDELASKITILREDISNLVNDINDDVLKKIRESMREQEEFIKNEKLEIRNDEEIPLPPYAKTTKAEEKIPEPPKEKKVVLEDITMPKDEPKNVMEDKLKGVTMSNHNVSDYSAPKITAQPSTTNQDSNSLPRSFDPYREQF